MVEWLNMLDTAHRFGKGSSYLSGPESKEIKGQLWAKASADLHRENRIVVKDIKSPKDRFGPEAIELHNGPWLISATTYEA